MKKQITITKVSVQKRIAGLIESKVRGAVSIFSETPEVRRGTVGDYWEEITVAPAGFCKNVLTFSEIDTVREVVDKYIKKYHGIGYCIGTRPYLASDNDTWLSQPIMKIDIRRYDTDIFNEE